MTKLQKERIEALGSYIGTYWGDLNEAEIQEVRNRLNITVIGGKEPQEDWKWRISQGDVVWYFHTKAEMAEFFGLSKTMFHNRTKNSNRYNNYLIESGCWDDWEALHAYEEV